MQRQVQSNSATALMELSSSNWTPHWTTSPDTSPTLDTEYLESCRRCALDLLTYIKQRKAVLCHAAVKGRAERLHAAHWMLQP